MREKFNERKIKEKIQKIDRAMAQEGMPLTQEIKDTLYKCLSGKNIKEIERKKIIKKYRSIYG